MGLLFSFAIRLFIAFVAAKMILRYLEADSPGYLISLTALFLANTYLFDFLDYHHQGFWRRQKRRRPETSEKHAEPEETPPESPSP